MQLRHIRPGSLEWQDANAVEVDPSVERLTPEEISRLRTLSDEPRAACEDEKRASAAAQ
jgi:hypothetical protein